VRSSEKVFKNEKEVAQLAKEGKKVVLFQGVVYDVEEYMPTHPGGEDFIKDELGTNIEEKFEEAEHTKAARKIFKSLPVVGRMKNEDSTSSSSKEDEKNTVQNDKSENK
jgi:cytochrome b involved in lipid metabolism